MKIPGSRDDAMALDRADPIARFRDDFDIPKGVIYLDGNSLGPPPRQVFSRIEAVMRTQWGGELVRAWTSHDWIDLPDRVAARIAPLIGASKHEVVVADSTSVNIFKLLAAALKLRPGRTVILSERQNFGTDLYVAQGLAELLDYQVALKLVDRTELATAIDGDVAVVMLTHVDFRSGEMHDMERWTEAAHEAGALVLWDLAHSAGALAVDLSGCGADLAVGCGYKYLNGGPGAPAFAFVAERHHGDLKSPLTGWMGHAAPFEFDTEYRPAEGVAALKVGTPPILSLAALECGVEGLSEIGIDRIRRKSLDLADLLVALVEERCAGSGLEMVSPRDRSCRGSQVSFRHRDAYAVVQALIAEGVIGDFRDPDLMRFGLTPAYLRFVDIWDAVEIMRRVLDERRWDRPEFRERAKVT